MEAQSLNCPNCGAAVSADSTSCEHCNSRLATVACPKCFGMLFLGSKFCPHCGAQADRREFDADLVRNCPRCRVNTKAVVIGKTDLRECPRCEGIWADADALQKLCADREQQAAVLGVATNVPVSVGVQIEPIRYVPCPACSQLMNRVNFARCSNVIVDVCRQHGTWFDKDELRRIVEFIQAGGFEKARTKEIAELESKRRELEAARAAGAGSADANYYGGGYNSREGGIADVAISLISSFFD